MIFESHAHYDDDAFDSDRDSLLASLPQNGIEYLINVSADLDSISSTLALAHDYPFIFGAVGVHPDGVHLINEDNFHIIEDAALDERIVSIGEIGLDYHYEDGNSRDLQKKWFIRQVLLAKEINKPIIIHSRDAASDTIDIMNSEDFAGSRGVIHCYSYTVETAKQILKHDFYFGVGGVVTFKNARKLVETVEYLPMDRILLETDCPYLAPIPFRGERNSSLYLPIIAEKIGQIKGITTEEVIAITNQNAKRLFFNKE